MVQNIEDLITVSRHFYSGQNSKWDLLRSVLTVWSSYLSRCFSFLCTMLHRSLCIANYLLNLVWLDVHRFCLWHVFTLHHCFHFMTEVFDLKCLIKKLTSCCPFQLTMPAVFHKATFPQTAAKQTNYLKLEPTYIMTFAYSLICTTFCMLA